MSDIVYQLVSECAYVTVNTAMGRAKTLLLKGALVDGDAPEVGHLLATGHIVKVGGDETGGLNADGVTLAEATGKVEPPGSSGGQQPAVQETASDGTGLDDKSPEDKAAAEVAERRRVAQEKLDGMDGAPDGRASKDVLVEYLVRQGGSYGDLVKADKPDLVEMVKSRQQ